MKEIYCQGIRFDINPDNYHDAKRLMENPGGVLQTAKYATFAIGAVAGVAVVWGCI